MSEWTDKQRKQLRVGLALLAITPAFVGIWALFAPRGFYDGFPGAGREWVSPLGPYDEHLVRDVGALYVGTLVLTVLACVWLERRLVQATLVAYVVAALPHTIYHATALEGFSTGDAVAEMTGLALGVVLPVALLFLTFQRRPATAAQGQPIAGGGTP